MRTLLCLMLSLCCTALTAADKPPLPAIFQEAAEPPKVDGNVESDSPDDVFGSHQTDDIAKLKEAVNYLYLTKLDEEQTRKVVREELARLNIRVQTPSGTTTTKVVSVGSDWRGHFQLGPGETLAGYQDPITGAWVDLTKQQPSLAYTQSRQPVHVYQSSEVELRAMPTSVSRPVRAGIQINPGPFRQWISGNSGGGSCRQLANGTWTCG